MIIIIIIIIILFMAPHLEELGALIDFDTGIRSLHNLW